MIGFLTSLLYEVTQLTGLFFIYPRAYRIFDIDDLIINTLGAYLGYVIDYIDRGIPIMVDWVEWAGHWQVIIGIDTCGSDTPYDDVLIFADPYDITDHYQDGYYIFPLSRFYGMWREGPCRKKTNLTDSPLLWLIPNNGKEN